MKFDHNGIGKLADAQSCTVTEKRNGSYELKLVCPADGIHAEMLEEGNIILAKPSDTGQSQPFRIYKITTPIDGKLEVQARHISYQLNFITVSPFSVTGCVGAMQGLKSHAASDCPFDVWTDVDSNATFTLGVPSSFRNCLGGTDASVLDTFGGEFEWDRYTVKFHKTRGADHNVHIIYGKNLTDFKMEKSIENTITGVHPYWVDNETQAVMELPEKVVLQSKRSIPYQKITVLDCTSNFQEKPSEAALREYAQNYIDTTDLTEPEIDIKIDFLQLWNTPGYEDIVEAERVSLCDTVHVFISKLGIGNRIVPRHDGVWDKAKEYEPLTIVYEEATGDSYLSRKPVPAGTLLSQEEYWAMCSRFSEQMALYRQNTAEEVEQFRKDTAADVEQLRTDTASDVAALRKMTAQDVADITRKVDAANSAVAASKSEMDKTAETLKAQINANVKASTDKNANYAQELVDARVDDEGKTYPTAGDNIRAIGRVRSMQNIMKNWVIKNGFVNQNGNLLASEDWRAAYMVPVSGGAILVDGPFGYMSGRDDYNNVVCYDADRKYLGGCFRAENGKIYDNYVVTLLPNTCFISVTTNAKLQSKLSVYFYDNMLPLRLLSNYATGWQWMNGSVDIRLTGSKVTVTFPEGKDVYVCRRTNGTQYEQTKLGAENSTSVDFTAKGWWAIYYDGMEVSADETGEKIELPVIKVENTGGDWGGLFTRNRFVFAILYQANVVYAAPSNSGTVINGIDYGNPAKTAYNSMTWHKYRSAKMFLATGQFAIDTVNRTIQVTKRILAVVDNGAYYWLSASEEPVPMLDSTEAEKHHMLILAYDSSIDQINLYNTAQFRALGVNGYYIAAWYENHFWYPHMGSSFSIVLDGTTYKAGELFDEERRDSYIEKKYEDRFQQLRTDLAGKDSRHMYLASGGITIDQDGGTIQVSTKCLGVPDTFHYEWIMAGDPVEMAFNTPSSTFGMPMRILAYDAGTKTINLYDTSLFRKLGTNGFYIASWYQSKLYNPHIHPDVKFIVGGKEYKAGDLFADNAASFIPKRITDYVQKAITPAVEDDIVTPSHWDCMESRQLSIFFDCLSRHDGKENLYVLARGTNAPSLTRNEYCMNYTPTKDSTDFALTVRRLDEDDCHMVSSKPVQVRVHHKLKDKLTKNICICGDSLVDNGSVATEVYRLLAEDNDCVIHQLGTRGPEGGKHEGRGSWTFARYLADTDYAGKTNAFWDKIKGRLDFQKYCETNGYEGIDYFLIALGTNDVSQGTTLYRTEAEVQKFVDQAKQFIDALLDKETGFPNCKIGIGLCGPGSDYSYQCGSSMGIFHMSINTLNLALIKAFDAGKYRKNVTCFAHGLRTDRRLAFPYSDKPVTNRFTETSRTLTNSIHPSGRGYQAWADGYYCQIRAWLTEDSK